MGTGTDVENKRPEQVRALDDRGEVIPGGMAAAPLKRFAEETNIPAAVQTSKTVSSEPGRATRDGTLDSWRGVGAGQTIEVVVRITQVSPNASADTGGGKTREQAGSTTEETMATNKSGGTFRDGTLDSWRDAGGRETAEGTAPMPLDSTEISANKARGKPEKAVLRDATPTPRGARAGRKTIKPRAGRRG